MDHAFSVVYLNFFFLWGWGATFSSLLYWKVSEGRFKRRATAVPNSIDGIKFYFSRTFETESRYCRVARKALPCYTAMARLGFKRRATAVPNAIQKL